MLKDILKKLRPMRIGIDIDGTLTENPKFFKRLSRSWWTKIYIITAREPDVIIETKNGPKTLRQITENYLKRVGVHYSKLIMGENKALVCRNLQVEIMYENDLEEMIQLRAADVFVVCVPGASWEPWDMKRKLPRPPKNINEVWDYVFKTSQSVGKDISRIWHG